MTTVHNRHSDDGEEMIWRQRLGVWRDVDADGMSISWGRVAPIAAMTMRWVERYGPYWRRPSEAPKELSGANS